MPLRFSTSPANECVACGSLQFNTSQKGARGPLRSARYGERQLGSLLGDLPFEAVQLVHVPFARGERPNWGVIVRGS